MSFPICLSLRRSPLTHRTSLEREVSLYFYLPLYTFSIVCICVYASVWWCVLLQEKPKSIKDVHGHGAWSSHSLSSPRFLSPSLYALSCCSQHETSMKAMEEEAERASKQHSAMITSLPKARRMKWSYARRTKGLFQMPLPTPNKHTDPNSLNLIKLYSLYFLSLSLSIITMVYSPSFSIRSHT